MSPGEVSDADNRSLDGLCRKRRWVDGLPSGLRSSYLHLYQCVRGLGCEDAAVIERYVILYFDVCYSLHESVVGNPTSPHLTSPHLTFVSCARDVLRTAGAVKEGVRLFRDKTELGEWTTEDYM